MVTTYLPLLLLVVVSPLLAELIIKSPQHAPLLPPLLCEVYNRRNTSSRCPVADHTDPNCVYTQSCPSPTLDATAACMAVYKDGAVEIKGCWNWEASSACLPLPICDAYPAGPAVSFCCCTSALCNHNVIAHEGPFIPTVMSDGSHMPEVDADDSSVHMIVGYTIVPLVIVAFLIVLVYFCVRRWQYGSLKTKHVEAGAIGPLTSDGVGLLAPTATSAAQPFRPAQPRQTALRVAPSTKGGAFKVHKIKIVAQGRFGQVWQGSMKTAGGIDQYVAVKVFPSDDSESWVQEQEIYSLDSMKDHPNILRYIGSEAVGIGPLAEYWLMTEFHPNLSLHHYLKSHTLTTHQLLQICVGTLRGLAYMHEESVTKDGVIVKPTVVHRDFKSGNVLLANDLTARIGDFGLAIQCGHGKTSSSGQGHQVGTRRYMAPEVLERATEFSAFAYRQIDVYAAALVLWECVTRTDHDRLSTLDTDPDAAAVAVPPYKLPYEAEVGVQPGVEQMCMLVCKNGKRPKIETAWRADAYLTTVCTTMEEMWDMEAEARVTAGCACERLESVLKTYDLSISPPASTAAAADVDNTVHELASTYSDDHPSDPRPPNLVVDAAPNDDALVDTPLMCEEGRLSRCSTHSGDNISLDTD